MFSQEQPTREDWILWEQFWQSYCSNGLRLPCPQGDWKEVGHRIWQWLYNTEHGKVYKQTYNKMYVYDLWVKSCTRAGSMYSLLGEVNVMPVNVTPITVRKILPGVIAMQGAGPKQLTPLQAPWLSFWNYGLSCEEDWMWDYVSDRESDPSWVKDALTTGTAIFSTDGSFRPKADALVSGAGWVIACTKTRRTLEGSFYEWASSASSYRGELLGLVAIHTFILAAATYYNLLQLTGTICCDNQSALNNSRRKAQRIQASTKQADLFRSLRQIHSKMPTQVITYVWVKAHVDRTTAWSRLSLLQQLSTTCNQLANSAVTRALSRAGNKKPAI
jgi:hypothetical protein